MATLKEKEFASVIDSNLDLPAREQPYYRTTERRHVDVLLDLSEEDFLMELEPHEYHCYSGWEEAVSE